MSQTKIAPGVYMIQGRATKDAKFIIAGKKNTHITSFSLAVGKNKDTTTIFANCKAFNRIADYAQYISKGDSVLCIGTIQESEYEGKTYTDFICEWLNFVGSRQVETQAFAQTSAYETPQLQNDEPKSESARDDCYSDDDDLPF